MIESQLRKKTTRILTLNHTPAKERLLMEISTCKNFPTHELKMMKIGEDPIQIKTTEDGVNWLISHLKNRTTTGYSEDIASTRIINTVSTLSSNNGKNVHGKE